MTGSTGKHRVYTLFPSSQNPGFLPSGSQAGIKRSKSWLDQDNTGENLRKHEATQVLSSPFIFPHNGIILPQSEKVRVWDFASTNPCSTRVKTRDIPVPTRDFSKKTPGFQENPGFS